MVQVAAYSTLAMTVTLALTRPRLRPSRVRVTPGSAALLGVIVLVALRLVAVADLAASLRVQWRPLLSLASIMLITGVVDEVGAFARLAARVEAYARRTSAARAFALVFAVSLVTPSLLNNDAAVLLLTPLVVALTRRLYPGRAGVTEAFAFAVFLAPGVAPLIVSNPMNMIVAEYAGIRFNAYALAMLPLSIVGALATFAVLRWRFARVLAGAVADPRAVVTAVARHPAERGVVALLVVVLASYPIAAALGGPIWMVTVAGAIASLALARAHDVAPLGKLAGHVSGDILVFLWGVFLIVGGLRHVGVVSSLSSWYALADGGTAKLALVGATAAIGSAVVDNHPMSILNMLALGAHCDRALLAALVGGDLGPRLLPIGSLAGLLWMDLMRRANAPVPLGRFVRVGALALVPALVVSLALLAR